MNTFNRYKEIKPYLVKNKMLKQMEITDDYPSIQEQLENLPEGAEVGYLNVGVFTASGALPVPNAVVTVYHTHEENVEHVLYHLVSDSSGRVPEMPLPVLAEEDPYIFSTYNMRVEATGYYPVNIIDIRIFPDISTNYRLNLIPSAQGVPDDSQERTIVIPQTPLDIPSQ